MIHDITSEWRVVTDSHNWVLERLTKPARRRDGSLSDPKWVPRAYCASLSQCVRRCCEEVARDSETLPDALRALVVLSDRVDAIAGVVA